MKTKMLTTVAAALVTSVACADVTYSDGTFQNSTWGFETVTLGGATSTANAAQSSGTGNPGFSRRVNHTTQVGETIYALHRFGVNTATRYEPALQGAILTLDWSIDARWASGSFGGDGQAIMLGAKQGMTIFFADYDITGFTGAWVTNTAVGLTAASFLPLTGSGSINFSAGGAPIRFGYITGNSTTGFVYNNTVDYDNFNLVVRSVPGVGVLPALAGGLLFARRRRGG